MKRVLDYQFISLPLNCLFEILIITFFKEPIGKTFKTDLLVGSRDLYILI